MEITKIITFNPSYLLETNNLPHRKLESLFSSSDPTNVDYPNDDFTYDNHSSNRTSNCSISNSPPSTVSSNSNPSSKKSSPWIHSYSHVESPWAHQPYENKYGLIGSLFIDEGHIYSIAAARDLLFTGSECKNVRVWKNLRDYSEFKYKSGMVKAIVVFGEKIFTGHPDGKIRVWTFLGEKRRYYNHDGNLPKTQDLFVKSLNPLNYVKVRSKRKIPWLKHYDTVSCMSVDAVQGLLYSGSWDKTVKVWRISDSKCLESIPAHDDAVNSVVTASEGLVFTGSADGTVKAWRREFLGKWTKHLLVATLLKKESAVTALVVSHAAGVVYGGSSDGLVRFWQVEKRLMAYGGVLRGHKMAVLCLVTGGKLVMSGSADKSICVWRRGDGGWHACMAVLTGHCAPVKCLAVVNETSAAEEEGHPRWIVYSGSLDKSVKIWRVSE